MTKFLTLHNKTKKIKIKDLKTGKDKSFQNVISGSLGNMNKKICERIANIEGLKKISIEKLIDENQVISKSLSLVGEENLADAKEYCMMVAEASLVKYARGKNIISNEEANNYEYEHFDGTYSKYIEFIDNFKFGKVFTTEQSKPGVNVLAKKVEVLDETVVDSEDSFYSFRIGKIVKKCIAEYKNGLAIIPLHTGAGKTYATTSVIAELEFTNWVNKKIVFVTNLKANLPEKDIKNKLRKFCVNENKLKNIVKVNNTVDWTIEKFMGETPESIDNIFDELNNFFMKNMCSEDKKKFDYISSSLKNCIKSSIVSSEVANTYKQNIEILKGNFQSEILRHFHQHYKWAKKKRADRYDFIMTNAAGLERIFPEIAIEKADVILLSTLKFMHGIGGILEPANDIRDSLFLSESAVIFIDEVDTAKEEINKFFIEMGITRKINLLSIASHLTLYSKKIENLAMDTIVSDKDRTNIQILVSHLDKFDAKYDTSRIYKSRDEDFECAKYMFSSSDGSFLTNLKDNNSVICLNQNIPANIEIKNKKDLKNSDIFVENFIRDFINDIFRRFLQLIGNIATTRYFSQKDKNPSISIDSEITSILNVLGFKDEETNNALHYLISKNRYLDIRVNSIGDNIYESGIRLIRIDNNDKDLESQLNFITLEETAESFLASLAKKHLVLGLSATGTIENCISNFNLKYLKKAHPELSINIEKMPEYNELVKFHNNKLRFASKQNIEYKVIENSGAMNSNINLTRHCLKYHFASRYNYKIDDSFISELIRISNNDSFYMDRYLYILDAMFEIIRENNHYGGIVYCPASLQEFKSVFLNIADDYAKKNGFKRPKIETLIKGALSDEGFLNRQKEILSKIDSESVLFIFTTFKTAGEGLNLNRILERSLLDKFVYVSDLKSPRLEVDLDFIIFDNPTYIINEQPSSELSDKIRSILAMGECVFNGSATKAQFDQYSKEILSSLKTSISLKDTYDYLAAIIRMIMQAIGRLGRTDFKNEKTTIIFRTELFNNLKKGRALFPQFISYETIKLLEFLDKNNYVNSSVGIKVDKQTEEKEETNTTNVIISKEKIHEEVIFKITEAEEKLKGEVNKSFSSNLKKYRQKQKVDKSFIVTKNLKRDAIFLVYPTATEEELEELERIYPGIKKYYIKIGWDTNSYLIGYNGDGKIMSFGKANLFANKTLRVSSDGASLGRLTKNPEIKEFLETNGFVRNWEPKEYIILPAVFQKFYEGTLGEELCKFVFDKLFNAKINSLPTKHYERFDGVTEINGKKIYIDAKYFQESSDEFTANLISNAKKKLDIVGGDYAVIINLRPQEKEFKITTDDNVVMIPAVFNTVGDFFNKDALIKSILR